MEEFVRRNLGDEVFERLIEPFCSGMVITISTCSLSNHALSLIQKFMFYQ